MADRWTTVPWESVEPRDFVRRGGTVYLVKETALNELANELRLKLYSPTTGDLYGGVKIFNPVDVRTEKNGEPTAAGRRLVDGLTHEGESALQRLLGAELIATQTTGTPPVVPKRMDAQTLASHLKLFHELYAGEVKAKDGAGLREVHREFHAAPFSSHSGRRIPHVHDDTSFGG